MGVATEMQFDWANPNHDGECQGDTRMIICIGDGKKIRFERSSKKGAIITLAHGSVVLLSNEGEDIVEQGFQCPTVLCSCWISFNEALKAKKDM